MTTYNQAEQIIVSRVGEIILAKSKRTGFFIQKTETVVEPMFYWTRLSEKLKVTQVRTQAFQQVDLRLNTGSII